MARWPYETGSVTGNGAAGTGRAPRLARVLLAALAIAGVAGAAMSAELSYSNAAAHSEEVFRAEASSISTALLAEVRRDEDFVENQSALFETFPTMTNRHYRELLEATGSADRYPGGLGFGYLALVPASKLPAFVAEMRRDPILGEARPKLYKPYPALPQSDYCLLRLAFVQQGIDNPDAVTFNYCFETPISPFPAALAAARDSGSLVIAPPVSLYPGVFYLLAPVYRSGSATSLAARRRDLTGWALGSFNGKSMLGSALSGVHGFSARVSYQSNGAPALVASVGNPASGSQFLRSVPTGARSRWIISVRRAAPSGAFGQALLIGLLVLAMALTLLLAVWQLLRSRARALRLVDERTNELRHQTLHDGLTGLPNRALVVDRVEQMLARARRERVATGVLFIDLDNFKDINDSFGHHRGDQLLQAVAHRLSTVVRPNDSVGRLGGDEFVVLVEDRSLDAGPVLVARRVLEAMAQPFVLPGLEGIQLTVRASIGVAAGPRASAEDLLRDADVALYQAKREGKGRLVVFHPEMQLAVQERLALEIDLRDGIDRGQLFVEYQPIFALDTFDICGVEALVRWRHPERGVLAPDLFVPVAEETGLILPLGRFVLKESCSQAAIWNRAGQEVPLSVNISGRQLASEDLPGDVKLALDRAGLDPSLLTLEFSESVLLRDVDASAKRLQALKHLGVRLAIDDFGTGYASLSYVRRLPLDALKIDRSFIAAVSRSVEARALLETLVQLGKSLGLDTLAEGIEEEGQLVELQRQHCDLGQGFLYSRPLSPEAIESLLLADRPAKLATLLAIARPS